MTLIGMLWLSVITLAASFLCLIALINPVGMNLSGAIMRRIGGYLEISALSLSVIVHVGAAAMLAVKSSLGLATAVLSTIAFAWGSFAYFQLQRFAEPFGQPEMVRNHPLLLPLLNLVIFASSALAFALSAGWYWAALPVVTWFILGLVTAELAIRRVMNRSEGKLGRKTAISAVNRNQGREGLLSCGDERYPFP